MTIVAARGLFVRLLVASGKFQPGDAEAFADALDAASKDPATKADLAEVPTEIALLSQRVDAPGARLDDRIDTTGDRLFLRLGGLMFALLGAQFAALRLTQP